MFRRGEYGVLKHGGVVDISLIATIAGILMITVNVIVLVLTTGRWSSKQEGNIKMVLQELESFKTNCNQQCTTRMAGCQQRFIDIDRRVNATEEYAHNIVNHGVRNELQNLVNRLDGIYARKELVSTQFESLNDLMDTKFKDIIDRLDRMENGKKPHVNN